jgi:hypothetical protein
LEISVISAIFWFCTERERERERSSLEIQNPLLAFFIKCALDFNRARFFFFGCFFLKLSLGRNELEHDLSVTRDGLFETVILRQTLTMIMMIISVSLI